MGQYMRDLNFTMAKKAKSVASKAKYHTDQKCFILWKNTTGKASDVIEVLADDMIRLGIQECPRCYKKRTGKALVPKKYPNNAATLALPIKTPKQRWPMLVQIWRTSDGREFESQGAAAIHQLDLNYHNETTIVGLPE